jgi:hypothetical protein
MRFWTDKWLDGRSISQLAPSLSRAVPKGTRKSRVVRDAIPQASWIQDISCFVSVQALREYVHLWVRIQSVHLQERIPDRFLWRWTSDQKYSTSSAYHAFYIGQSGIPGMLPKARAPPTCKYSTSSAYHAFYIGQSGIPGMLRKARAPPTCKFLLWLALLDRCWTYERLQRHC